MNFPWCWIGTCVRFVVHRNRLRFEHKLSGIKFSENSNKFREITFT